jgi:hypothetical protein
MPPNLSWRRRWSALLRSQTEARSDLRHIEAACCALKEHANALVAMLIARDTDEDLVTEAEVLTHHFEQVEVLTAGMIDARRSELTGRQRETLPKAGCG